MNRRGFSMIELIVVMVIIFALATLPSGILLSLLRSMFYVPAELQVRAAARDIIYTMVEGEESVMGVRYANLVKDASTTQFTYTFGYPGNTDKRNVRFVYNAQNHNIRRSYSAFGSDLATPPPNVYGNETILQSGSSTISVQPGTAGDPGIFYYYKADGSAWGAGDPLKSIRRVEIRIAVQTGQGQFSASEGYFNTVTDVDIKQY